MRTAREWIDRLELRRHPEGGYYRETYRASETIPPAALPDRFIGARSFSTAVYFLLEQPDVSRFHRLRSDEIWHFHCGDPTTLFAIDAQGELTETRVGSDPERGEAFQAVIRAGTWFGAALDPGSGFVLVGCTVAPGFDFADFELGRRDELLAQYPRHRSIIERLTPAKDAHE